MAVKRVADTSSKGQLANRLRPGSARVRSCVTNGHKAYVHGDGQSAFGRRQLDLIALHVEDLGGFDVVSEAQLSLCRRVAALETQLEMLEGQMSLGEAVDLDQFARLATHTRHIVQALGLGRGSKRKPPPPKTLADIVKDSE